MSKSKEETITKSENISKNMYKDYVAFMNDFNTLAEATLLEYSFGETKYTIVRHADIWIVNELCLGDSEDDWHFSNLYTYDEKALPNFITELIEAKY